jgi:flagellar protein FlgJ
MDRQLVTVPPTRPAAAPVSAAPQAPVTMQASRVVAPQPGKPAPYVQFEAFVLQSFVQTMLPKDASAVFGEGTAGDIWKSMLAEKMALQIAESGGIGIAKMLAAKNASLASGGGSQQAPMAAQLLDLQLSDAARLAGTGAVAKGRGT